MEWIEGIFAVLNQGWVASLIGLAGLVIGVILFVKSRTGPRLVYQQRALQLIGSAQPALPGEIEVSYKGVTVPRLTATYIVLWNAGTETARGSDVVATDPLRFVFEPGTQVLRARVVKATRPVIEFQVAANPNVPNEVLLSFDYLDIRDGSVVEILHTSENRYPQVQGTIRGLPDGLRDWGRVAPQESFLPLLAPLLPLRIDRRLRYAVFIGVGLGFAAIGVALPVAGWPPRTDLDGVRRAFVVMGLLYVALPASALWWTRHRFPRSLLTDELAS